MISMLAGKDQGKVPLAAQRKLRSAAPAWMVKLVAVAANSSLGTIRDRYVTNLCGTN